MCRTEANTYLGLNNIQGVLGQDELEDYTATLCADKRNEELFRLQTGETNCRDVVQCTDSVNLEFLFLSKEYLIPTDFYPGRAFKPFGAPLVLLLTLRSKVATGGSLLTTATRKPQQGELSRESATLRSSVTEGSSRAGRSPPLCAFAESSFVTVRRTVAMGRMKALAVCFFKLILDTTLFLLRH